MIFKKLFNENVHELSEEQTTQLRHQRVRSVRKNTEALSDLPVQLFLRLVGLFYSTPETLRNSDECKSLSVEFINLRGFIDDQLAGEDGKNFAKYEMADYVHNLHLLIAGIVEIDFVEANTVGLREEYRGHVSELTYNAFLTSEIHTYINNFCIQNKDNTAVDKTLYNSKLRLEYKTLINEIRKARLYEEHVESTRGFLMRKLGETYMWVIATPLCILILYAVFIGWVQHLDRAKAPASLGTIITFLNSSQVLSSDLSNAWFNGLLAVALFSLSAIAGATGAMISALLRIQGVRDNNQLAQNIVAFKFSLNAIRLAPLTGLVFAMVLSFLFTGDLIGGLLFPSIGTAQSWANILFEDARVSKWIIWCFIAGFSERLVPDMIDKLSDKAKKAN